MLARGRWSLSPSDGHLPSGVETLWLLLLAGAASYTEQVARVLCQWGRLFLAPGLNWTWKYYQKISNLHWGHSLNGFLITDRCSSYLIPSSRKWQYSISLLITNSWLITVTDGNLAKTCKMNKRNMVQSLSCNVQLANCFLTVLMRLTPSDLRLSIEYELMSNDH